MEQGNAMVIDKERSYRVQTTAAYFATFLALGLTHASLGPTLAGLAEGVGVNLAQISFVFTARSIGYLVGSVAGGRLYDLVGGHPVMGGMLFLSSLMMAVTPLASVLWVLIAMLFLLGMFEGAVDVGGNTLLVWVQRDRVAPYMNALHFFFGVGAAVSPLIIGLALRASGGIRWSYWALALLVLPVGLFVASLPSPQSLVRRKELAEGAGGQPPAVLRDPGLVALLVVFFFLYVGAEGSFGGWIATYAQNTGFGDATTAAYLTSVFWSALTAGRLLSIPIAAWFTPRQVLFGDLLACVLSVGVLLLWPGEPVATWIGTIGAGLAMASIFPTAMSMAGRYMTMTGTITSMFFVGGSLGGMVWPVAIGQLFERVGPRVTPAIIMGAVGLALLEFVGIALYTRHRTPDNA